jgi:uncharacterized protein YecT (DUF1311 family)
MTESRFLDPEDEAFNEIERRSIAKKDAVKAQLDKPQRTWVGLTVEEIEAIGKPFEEKDGSIQAWGLFACAIEAKLKEKNT